MDTNPTETKTMHRRAWVAFESAGLAPKAVGFMPFAETAAGWVIESGMQSDQLVYRATDQRHGGGLRGPWLDDIHTALRYIIAPVE